MGRLLDAEGLSSAVFEDAAEFCAALTGEVGVLLMSEEALFGPAGAQVHRLLAAQEDWSAIPLIVLTGGALAAAGADALRGFEGYGRVTLLERPVRLAVLATVVRMAVTARLQQYRVQDLLAERADAIARRDDFLAMLGHELRNPLGAVSTCAEVLVQGPSAPQGEECARIIRAQARDMKRLLDDLLDVSRLTRGRLALRREPVELGRDPARRGHPGGPRARGALSDA
jgi:two-component system, sensor histidine kinase